MGSSSDQQDGGVMGSGAGVSEVDSFEFCSIYILREYIEPGKEKQLKTFAILMYENGNLTF